MNNTELQEEKRHLQFFDLVICVVNLCTIVLTEREVCPEVVDGTGNQKTANKNN